MADDREALTKQVKEANDIVDVVGSYVALRPAGQTFKGLCPFHDDSRPSFDVDPRRQRYRCWSCGKVGDVYTFIQEIEHVDFLEARELLARRAGITLEKKGRSPHSEGRARMLEVTRWAAEQFHRCLLDSPLAEAARRYLGERGLAGETVRRFGVGYAPLDGTWLLQRAAQARLPLDLLEKVGLIARRQEGEGHYDRFRDRVMFPIRDVRGQPVGFGGRVLPTSPNADRAPKYYNSSETELFAKSELLYGLDLARHEAAKAGYLAVVEGYTDVLMAHQHGIVPVVATMGTALNARHVRQLRRFAPRVVLVFDADEGGDTGVDRALEIFASHDVDLAIATLPAGLDPCDLLAQQGPGPFRLALTNAVDALEFKLQRVLVKEAAGGIEGKRRALDAVLGIIALAPEQSAPVKTELIVTRIAQRLGLKEETVWARLKDLRQARQRHDDKRRPGLNEGGESEKRQGPARAVEKRLLEVLLAEPALVAEAAGAVAPSEFEHPGLRKLLDGLYRLQAAGATPDLDNLRPLLAGENPRLVALALDFREIGLEMTDRNKALRDLVAEFCRSRDEGKKRELHDRLHAAQDHAQALALLEQLQSQTVSATPGAP